ncbi:MULTISPECIES: hypothetical protein [Paenibacillus]|uniref:hypothetical protein n=1 Tax=Paenibacillus TaxID=44249 RepID=UPI0022B93F7B|nr:hypothetical protein [Paenibacillus caseinilyticus]MCZ8521279.1 hypothetical protein [Paenibacillus caseinilyticus]
MNIESAAQSVFVSAVSLKRWCVLMEKHGYQFTVDGKGERDFSERDMEAVKLISMKLLDKKELREAVKEVVEQYTAPASVSDDTQAAAKLAADREEIKGLIDHLFELRMKEYMESTDQRLADLEVLSKETGTKVSKLEKDQDAIVTEVLVLHERFDEVSRQNEAHRKIREDEMMHMMKEILETKRMAAAARQRRWQHVWKTVTHYFSQKKETLEGGATR